MDNVRLDRKAWINRICGQELRLIERMLFVANEKASPDFLRDPRFHRLLRQYMTLVRIECNDPENVEKARKTGKTPAELWDKGRARYAKKSAFGLFWTLCVMTISMEDDENLIRAAWIGILPLVREKMIAEGLAKEGDV